MHARWMGTLSLLLAAATTADAQPPLDYNHARAYHHFRMSRYSYRTLYSSIPGQGGTAVTPFGSSSYYVPGFATGYHVPFRRPPANGP